MGTSEKHERISVLKFGDKYLICGCFKQWKVQDWQPQIWWGLASHLVHGILILHPQTVSKTRQSSGSSDISTSFYSATIMVWLVPKGPTLPAITFECISQYVSCEKRDIGMQIITPELHEWYLPNGKPCVWSTQTRVWVMHRWIEIGFAISLCVSKNGTIISTTVSFVCYVLQHIVQCFISPSYNLQRTGRKVAFLRD